MTTGEDADDSMTVGSPTETMLEIYELAQSGESKKHYSGDGTWTEDEVICAVVEARCEAVAASKASAAFGCREDKPDTLWEYDRQESYEIAQEFKTLPRSIAETDWKQMPAIVKAGRGKFDDVVEQIISDSNFDAGESIVYNEWGTAIASEEDLGEALKTDDKPAWIVVGVALKPTGAGQGNDEYIGETASVYCEDCGMEKAECMNIVFEERTEEHIGIWECSGCGQSNHGPHPKEAVRQSVLNYD